MLGAWQVLWDTWPGRLLQPNPATDVDRRELWREWHRHVNMTERELRAFLRDFGDEAGLSRAEARAEGVRSGRDSARALLRMIPKGKSFRAAEEGWSRGDWDWAKRQVAFIKRMRGARGPLTKGGAPTRKDLALRLWGHDSRKPLRKVR